MEELKIKYLELAQKLNEKEVELEKLKNNLAESNTKINNFLENFKDFNYSVNVALDLTELLLETEITNSQKEYLNIIKISMENISATIKKQTTQPFTQTKELVFDDSVLGEIAETIDENKLEFIKTSLQGIETLLKNSIIKLHNAVEEKQYQDIILLSHNLKGSCLNLGITKVGKLAANLEILAKEQKTDKLLETNVNLKNSIEEFLIFYKKELEA